MNFLFQTILIGIGATIFMDVYSLVLNIFGIKTLDYRFVGRWIGHFFNGKFCHAAIIKTTPVRYEQFIGWTAHYMIGITFAFALVLIFGEQWLQSPNLAPALIIGIVSIVFPLFLMQPAFGLGFASSKLPNPLKARLMSLATHTVFGFGLFLSARLLCMAF
ncbi:DUF2938 domain-containing protein [Marinifilum sp.]|uniref:DUF2938 domain-containing protein n=1 Tax=Marinifilum sp. TaxID=2033137 RepID=UPI003BACC2E8